MSKVDLVSSQEVVEVEAVRGGGWMMANSRWSGATWRGR